MICTSYEAYRIIGQLEALQVQGSYWLHLGGGTISIDETIEICRKQIQENDAEWNAFMDADGFRALESNHSTAKTVRDLDGAIKANRDLVVLYLKLQNSKNARLHLRIANNLEYFQFMECN